MRPEEPVSRIMTETVVVIELDRPVSEALDCFSQYPIHHLPVVRQGRIAGMLSSADVMKLEYVVPKATVDRAKFLDERLSIVRLMRTPVVSLQPGVSVGEAAEHMMAAGDAEQVHYHQRPTAEERATAMRTAELLHVEARDPRFLGKARVPFPLQ